MIIRILLRNDVVSWWLELAKRFELCYTAHKAVLSELNYKQEAVLLYFLCVQFRHSIYTVYGCQDSFHFNRSDSSKS
jgi:hypothetical protein